MSKQQEDALKKVRVALGGLLETLPKSATMTIAMSLVELYDLNGDDWDEGDRDRLLRAMALANMVMPVHAERQATMLRVYYEDRAVRKTAIAQRAKIEAAAAQQKALPATVDAASGD